MLRAWGDHGPCFGSFLYFLGLKHQINIHYFKHDLLEVALEVAFSVDILIKVREVKKIWWLIDLSISGFWLKVSFKWVILLITLHLKTYRMLPEHPKQRSLSLNQAHIYLKAESSCFENSEEWLIIVLQHWETIRPWHVLLNMVVFRLLYMQKEERLFDPIFLKVAL